MTQQEDSHEFFCPFCRASHMIRLDPSAGSHQSLEVLCEKCFQPLVVDAEIDWDGAVSYDVRAEDE